MSESVYLTYYQKTQDVILNTAKVDIVIYLKRIKKD